MVLQGLKLYRAVEYEYKCTAGVKKIPNLGTAIFDFFIKITEVSEELWMWNMSISKDCAAGFSKKYVTKSELFWVARAFNWH